MGIREQTWSAALRLVNVPAVKQGAQTTVRAIADRTNYHVVRGMSDPGQRPDVALAHDASPWMVTTDYVRHATLHLVCQEIQTFDVPGAIGEVGVYQGDFSLLMSRGLPGRDVHLFDTFTGFDDRDVAQDAPLVDAFLDFSGTDPESVRSRFDEPARTFTHVGYFPESASDVADDVTFAIASIDADLYAPILSSLQWFWERLSPGGYILVHDFNNAAFGGAKNAVREFQAQSGASLVPVPDWGGTAVFAKPRS
ncbi:MAG: O-methyltransferase [Solirubrobacteraceae bacterium]|nr:O-methyltransferase [Solirubrobacteraceae bacterium]